MISFVLSFGQIPFLCDFIGAVWVTPWDRPVRGKAQTKSVPSANKPPPPKKKRVICITVRGELISQATMQYSTQHSIRTLSSVEFDSCV